MAVYIGIWLREEGLRINGSMKKLLTIFLTLFLFSSAYSEARVVDKLEYRDGVAYAVGENKGFSGQLVTKNMKHETRIIFKNGLINRKTDYMLTGGFLIKNLEIIYNGDSQEKIKINYQGGKETNRTVNEYFKNNQLKATRFYEPDNRHSKVYKPHNGYLISLTDFYNNKYKKSELNFTKNYSGKQQYFYKNGQLKREEIYLDGKNINCNIEWSDTGKKTKDKCYLYNTYRNEILPGQFVDTNSYSIYRPIQVEKNILSRPYWPMWILSIALLTHAYLRDKKTLHTNNLWVYSLIFFTFIYNVIIINVDNNYTPSPSEIYIILVMHAVLLKGYYRFFINNKNHNLLSIWALLLLPSLIAIALWFILSGYGYISILFLGFALLYSSLPYFAAALSMYLIYFAYKKNK